MNTYDSLPPFSTSTTRRDGSREEGRGSCVWKVVGTVVPRRRCPGSRGCPIPNGVDTGPPVDVKASHPGVPRLCVCPNIEPESRPPSNRCGPDKPRLPPETGRSGIESRVLVSPEKSVQRQSRSVGSEDKTKFGLGDNPGPQGVSRPGTYRHSESWYVST